MTRRVAWSAAADIITVVVFVVIGRRSHDEGSAVAGVAKVAAPFLIALAIAWLSARAWLAPTTARTGIAVWSITGVVGLVLRRFVFDRGTAVSFMIVAAIVLGFLLVGWRIVVTHRFRVV